MNRDQYERLFNRSGSQETPAEYYNRAFNHNPRYPNQERVDAGEASHIVDGVGQHRYVKT